MYPVSNAFLQAAQENTRNYYWTGKITTTGGAVHEFGYEDIVKGSGYISSQCCGNTEIELGTVYAAEMGIILFSQIDRYTLEKMQKLSCFIIFRLRMVLMSRFRWESLKSVKQIDWRNVWN